MSDTTDIKNRCPNCDYWYQVGYGDGSMGKEIIRQGRDQIKESREER